MTNPLTRQKAAAHENLYPALERLARQLEAMAVRNPVAAVPPATRAIAEGLLFDAQRFVPARRGLPETAADIGGLATQLGRALAGLDAFEAAHAAWNPDLKCFVWLRREPVPVKRLRPETAAIIKTARQTRDGEHIRSELIRRIDAKAAQAYDDGYADASSGRERRAGGH